MTRRTLWLALAFALVPYLCLVARFDFLCDDAFISFRYARNLSDGLGLRFNPGAMPPVEGYTEFLWVVALAGALELGWPLETAARVLGVGCGLALVAWTVRLVARRSPRPAAVFATALALGCLPPLAVWSTSGLGTMAFALAVFVLFERLVGDPARPRPLGAAAAAGLVVLLRADGALIVFLLVGPILLFGLARDRALARAALVAATAGLVVFAAHLLWRHATYDDWLPNTARAKVALSPALLARGARYVALQHLVVLALPLALVLPFVLAPLRWDRTRAFAVLGVLALHGYAVTVGGDFMAFGRFLVPALPLLAVHLGAGLAAFDRGRLRAGLVCALGVALAVGGLLPAFDVHPAPAEWREALGFRRRDKDSELQQWRLMRENARRWAELGRAVAAHTEPDATLVAGAVGALGYYSERVLYDRYGLVDREVALREREDEEQLAPGHDAVVPHAFFLDRAPTYLGAYLREPGARHRPFARKLPKELIPLDPAEYDVPEGTELVLVKPPAR